jgi:hypothetical protein
MYTPLDFQSIFSLCITDDDPITVREVVDSEDVKFWKKAMVEEIITLDKNEALDLIEFPTIINLAGNKWVFKKKLNAKC